MSLTREEILKHNDRDVQKLTIPEWGGDIYIRSLTMDEMVGLQDLEAEDVSDAGRILRGVIACVCDKDGKSLFTVEDVEALGGKNGTVILQLVKEIKQFNNVQAIVESMEKN